MLENKFHFSLKWSFKLKTAVHMWSECNNKPKQQQQQQQQVNNPTKVQGYYCWRLALSWALWRCRSKRNSIENAVNKKWPTLGSKNSRFSRLVVAFCCNWVMSTAQNKRVSAAEKTRLFTRFIHMHKRMSIDNWVAKSRDQSYEPGAALKCKY